MPDITQGRESKLPTPPSREMARRESPPFSPDSLPRHPQNIRHAERIAGVIAGGALVLYGMSRRSLAGVCAAGVGVLLGYRGMTGYSYLYERLGIERIDSPIELMQSLTVNRPAQEVYAFWRQLENLPTFMRHLHSVKQQTATHSHWVAQTTRRRSALEWDCEITEDRPNELLRWRSLADGGFQHAGEVRFQRAPGSRGTEVHIYLQYQPPAGVALTALMYPFSKQMLREEIRRLKQALEAGEIPTTQGQPSGRVIRKSSLRHAPIVEAGQPEF